MKPCERKLMLCSGEPRNDSVNQPSTLNPHPTPASAHQDGCRGEGEGGKTFHRAVKTELADEIAQALYPINAYKLPKVCQAFGLAEGTGEEAFSSKKRYVLTR